METPGDPGAGGGTGRAGEGGQVCRSVVRAYIPALAGASTPAAEAARALGNVNVYKAVRSRTDHHRHRKPEILSALVPPHSPHQERDTGFLIYLFTYF